MKTLKVNLFVLVLLLITSCNGQNKLKNNGLSKPDSINDHMAWEAAGKLLNSLGGKDIWATTKILYVKELAFPSRIKDTVVAEFWRDLEKPSYRSLITGANINNETRWIKHGGWIKRNGIKEKITKEIIDKKIADWYQEPYVIYHKLAIRDRSITIRLKGKTRLEIYKTDSKKLLCWFELDANGGLLMWGNQYNGQINEHVYGPIKQLGEFKMPAWGTSINGDWRFEYLEVSSVKSMLLFDD